MARARNIKPGFFINEELVELPFDVRLLFIGLWTIADREGRMEDRPLKIKISIFPADDMDVNRGLELLQTKGLISRYEVEGKCYIQVTNFIKHQKPHANEAESLIPSAVEALAPLVEALGSERGKRKEERGMLKEECAASPPAPLYRKETENLRDGDSYFDNPPVILFEDRMGFKIGSNFAQAIFARVKKLDVWDALLQDKIAYADKPLSERKKITHWILEEYEKRLANGTGKHKPSVPLPTLDEMLKTQNTSTIKPPPTK